MVEQHVLLVDLKMNKPFFFPFFQFFLSQNSCVVVVHIQIPSVSRGLVLLLTTNLDQQPLFRSFGMAFCLVCFSGDPHPDDPYGAKPNQLNVSLKDAPCKDPMCCCLGFFCPYPVIGKLRYDYLREDMTRYICCQGVIPDCYCFKPGRMGEKDCPYCCLCLEVVCCPGLSLSSTRGAVMSDYNLGSDPFDRKIIRCTNFLQMAACLCRVAAAFEPSCRDVADATSCIADFAFWTVMGCMASQGKV